MNGKLGSRIIVIGSPGAGKSTFSLKLGGVTGIKVHHMDRLFWLPNWTERNKDDFNDELKRILSEKSWIIDGNYQKTLKTRINHADTIVYLDFNRFVCMYRVMKRVRKWKGKIRPDMGEGCEERLETEFLKWVWNYRKRDRHETLKLIEHAEKNKNVIILKNSRNVKKFFKNFEPLLQ